MKKEKTNIEKHDKNYTRIQSGGAYHYSVYGIVVSQTVDDFPEIKYDKGLGFRLVLQKR